MLESGLVQTYRHGRFARPLRAEGKPDSEHRRYVGDDPGLATTLKLLANYLLMSGLATLSEVVRTAQAARHPDDPVRGSSTGCHCSPRARNRLDAIVSRHPRVGPRPPWAPRTCGWPCELDCSDGLRLAVAHEIKRLYEQAAAG